MDKTWTMTIYLTEGNVSSHAEAVLQTGDGRERRRVGNARRRPGRRHDPRIGDGLAVCRALAGVGADLLEAAVDKVLLTAPAACPDDRPVVSVE